MARPLDAIVLTQWVAWHQDALVGGRIQKITHPTPRELIFTFRGRGISSQANQLVISIQKTWPAVFLASNEQCRQLIQSTFTKATNWCHQLRKHLVGAKLAELAALPGERVIQLTLTNTNAVGEAVTFHLMLELMGRHSNVILVNAHNQHIIGVAHNVTEAMSQARQIAPGLPYTPPPVPTGKVWLAQVSKEELAQHLEQGSLKDLTNTYTGAGRHTWQDAQTWANDSSFSQACQWLLDAAHGQPGLVWVSGSESKNGFQLQPVSNASDTDGGATYNQGVFTQLSQQRVVQVGEQLQQTIARQQARWQTRYDELYRAEDNDKTAETYHHIGDLLATHAASQPSNSQPQHPEITLEDWQTCQPLIITVKTDRSWQDNAAWYYKQGRQQRQRQAHRDEQNEQLQQERGLLEQFAWAISHASTLPELWAIETELVDLGWRKSNQPKSAVSKKASEKLIVDAENTPGLLKLVASDGETVIYVGRQGQANSALLSHLSRAGDWWCHAKEYPGAHVVIRHPNPSDELLLDGLHLAAHFSGGGTSGKLPIVYTQRKFVRKIPNSAPGHVTYKQETEALITVAFDRVEALLAQPL